MNKWPLMACLAIVILMTIPEYSVARHDQGDRVSEAPDPGTTDAKDPSTAVMDGVTVIAYVRDSYTPANGDNYRLMLKASPDYCNVNWDYLQPFYVGSGTIRNQRNPDVTIVKMCKDFDPLSEEFVAFVTWQEENETTGHWEIWVSNVTINPSNGVISQTTSYQYPVKLSCYDPEEERFDAMYPRINGSYMPPYEISNQEDASSTMVMVVYQQEYTENQYGIYQSHMVYDYNTRGVGNPISVQWPTDDVVDHMGPDEQSNFLHPSIDTYMSQPYLQSSMIFCIVADEQYYQYYRCKFQSGSFILNPDVSSGVVWEINDYQYLFNELSSSPGYPDVAVRKPSLYYPVVVWQDDNGNAYAKEIYWAPDINLGPCKSPTMRGISIDDSPRQYDYIDDDEEETLLIREAWFNPGGFEVVWRSDTEKPGGGTYGIDSRNLEIKNNALRITHTYRSGFDDEYNDTYDPIYIYHETTDSSDTYVTIATDNSGKGVVSFLRSDDEIMAFRWIDYAEP